jgi:hypothetical protein
MAINNSAKLSSRRGKRTSKPSSPETENQAVEAKPMSAENTDKKNSSEAGKDETMATDNVVKIPARSAQEGQEHQAAIQLHHPSDFSDGSAMSTDIEIVGTYSEAGIRPVTSSHLELYDSYLNGRPISASHLQVFEMLPGGRPVFVSDLKIVDSELLPNHRPIMASDAKLLEGSFLPGGRPIAPNEVDDPLSLMGFLD